MTPRKTLCNIRGMNKYNQQRIVIHGETVYVEVFEDDKWIRINATFSLGHGGISEALKTILDYRIEKGYFYDSQRE